jgi:hypothetical protein
MTMESTLCLGFRPDLSFCFFTSYTRCNKNLATMMTYGYEMKTTLLGRFLVRIYRGRFSHMWIVSCTGIFGAELVVLICTVRFPSHWPLLICIMYISSTISNCYNFKASPISFW